MYSIRIEEKGWWKVSTEQKRKLVGRTDKSIKRRILQDLVEIYIVAKKRHRLIFKVKVV